MLALLKLVAGDVGQGQFLLTFVGLGPRVGLIVARAVAGIPDEPLEVLLGVASVVLQARERGISNFSVYASHKLIVPAMKAVLEGASRIEGFITPGHVSVIIGPEAYEEVARQYRAPCVATGFEPSAVLEGIAMLLECIAEKRISSFVQYTRVVKPGGNKRAWDMLMRVFNVSGAEWRGLGEIPGSGLVLKLSLIHI